MGDIFSAVLAPEHNASTREANHCNNPMVKEINSDQESPTVLISFYPFRHNNDI